MGMTKTLARAGLVALTVLTGVVVGTAWALPVLGFAAIALYRLADYGARETEHALVLASARRVSELTWELQTAAATLELERLRAVDRPLVHDRAYREPDLLTPAYGLPLLCGVAA